MKSAIMFVAVCITAFCTFFLTIDYFQDANHYTDMIGYKYGAGGGVLLWLIGAMLKDAKE